jgi:protein phosphatase 2C family protein 2/3
MEVARYLRDQLPKTVQQASQENSSDVSEALRQSFAAVDAEIVEHKLAGGSTACVAVVDRATNKLTIANAGDSRALLITSTGCEQLTIDHNTDDPIECARITQTGGYIIPVRSVPRV